MAKDDKRTLTPRLRFPEFRKENGWKVWPLAKLLSRPPEYGINAAAVPFSETLPTYLRITDIDDDGRFISEGKASVDAEIDEDNYMSDGDVVLARTGASVGKSYRYRECDGRLVFAGFLIRVRPDPTKLIPTLLASYLTTRQYWDWVRMTSARSGQPGINGSEYAALPIPLPHSESSEYGLTEQQKIADCLTSLDELIAAQGRRVEALKVHKKGLMQQLFPREGDTHPRLRFPEFRDAGEWESRKIRDLLEKVSQPVAVETNQTYREIGIRSHGKGIFHKDPVSGAAIGIKRVFRVVPGAFILNIIFAWERAVAFTTKNEAGMIASHRFPMYLPKSSGCDVRFLTIEFLTPIGKHLLGLASPGGAGRNRTLGQDEFEKLELVVPKVHEQARIADAVLAVDALIAAEAEKLAVLKTHKQGLMQQLFPSPEGD